jgi:hypothetical protein
MITVKLVSLVMPCGIETVTTEVLVVVVMDRSMLVSVMVAVGPVGVMDLTDRWTVSVNPFSPVRVRVVLPDFPILESKEVGAAVMVKSIT